MKKLLAEIALAFAFTGVGIVIGSNMIEPVVKYVEVPKVETRLIPAGKAEQGADNHYFEVKETNYGRLDIQLIYYDSLEQMTAAWDRQVPERKNPPGWRTNAFTQFTDVPGQCIIHVLDPAKVYMPTTFGHEVFHCAHGDWHPNQPAKLLELLKKGK